MSGEFLFDDFEPVRICEPCRKSYPLEYEYCPFCGDELVKFWRTSGALL